MKKIMAVMATSVLLISAVGAAMAQGQPPAGGPGGPGAAGGRMGGFGRPAGICPLAAVSLPAPQMMEFMAQRLQLTDDQKAKAKDILDKALVARKPLQDKAEAATKALREGLFAAEFNATTVGSLATAAQRAEAALVAADIATWGQLRGVLTAEQIKMIGQPGGGRRLGPGMGGNQPDGGVRGPRRGGAGTPPPPVPAE